MLVSSFKNFANLFYLTLLNVHSCFIYPDTYQQNAYSVDKIAKS